MPTIRIGETEYAECRAHAGDNNHLVTWPDDDEYGGRGEVGRTACGDGVTEGWLEGDEDRQACILCLARAYRAEKEREKEQRDTAWLDEHATLVDEYGNPTRVYPSFTFPEFHIV